MEALKTYKSFNSNKSIEELQYNISIDISKGENLKGDLEFYKFLIEKPIFKPHEMNLYEKLTGFKKEIKNINEKRTSLLNDLYSHSNKIRNKIECEDLACDNFFISEQDDIELETFNFYNTLSEFKFKFFQYLQSVIMG